VTNEEYDALYDRVHLLYLRQGRPVSHRLRLLYLYFSRKHFHTHFQRN
jgi:hypothetical protein